MESSIISEDDITLDTIKLLGMEGDSLESMKVSIRERFYSPRRLVNKLPAGAKPHYILTRVRLIPIDGIGSMSDVFFEGL